MKERLIEFLAYLGMGQTKFEEKVGLSRGFVHRLNDNITLKTLKKITDSYPELNTNWLKTGEGEMLKNNNQENNVSNNEGIVGIQGNGNYITNNDISKMIELQKGYQDMIKKKDEHIDRLLGIIENHRKL